MTNRKMQGSVGIAPLLLLAIIVVAAVFIIRHLSQADDAKNIRSVLQQHQQFGQILANRIGEHKEGTDADFERMAGYYDEYLSQLRNIDTHECPRDFAEAFYRYFAAIEDEAQVMHAHPHIPSNDQLLAASVQDGLEGEPGKQAREFKAEFEAWDKKQSAKAERANQAEQEMKAIATRYGAL